MIFLVAITSARCASELAALRSDYLYLQFYPDKVKLFVDISVDISVLMNASVFCK